MMYTFLMHINIYRFMHSRHSMSKFEGIDAVKMRNKHLLNFYYISSMRMGSRDTNIRRKQTVLQRERERLRQILSIKYSEYGERL